MAILDLRSKARPVLPLPPLPGPTFSTSSTVDHSMQPNTATASVCNPTHTPESRVPSPKSTRESTRQTRLQPEQVEVEAIQARFVEFVEFAGERIISRGSAAFLRHRQGGRV